MKRILMTVIALLFSLLAVRADTAFQALEDTQDAIPSYIYNNPAVDKAELQQFKEALKNSDKSLVITTIAKAIELVKYCKKNPQALKEVLGNDFEKATGEECNRENEKSYVYLKGYDAGYGDHINGRGVDAEKASTDFVRNEGALLLYLTTQIGDKQDFNTGYSDGAMACPTQSHDVM